MKVHHLNCGSFCPVGGRLFDGRSDAPLAACVCHCLLVETGDALVLIDTGYGMRDVRGPGRRVAPFFRLLCNPQFRESETAVAQIRALGFDPANVRHIVLTHLDFDHAGGIEDFPNARVHLLARERAAADSDRVRSFIGARRYRPPQWDEAIDWRLYADTQGEAWFGFDAVRDLDGLPPEILMVPLPGHTHGHAGVALRGDDGRWLFHAGDSYFYRGEMGDPYRCTPLFAAYQRMMEADRPARLANLDRVRALAHGHSAAVRVFCAHDPVEFDLLAATG